jgi:hypothetical protein
MAPKIAKNADLTIGHDAREKSWVIYADDVAVRFYHEERDARTMAEFYRRGNR